MTAGLRSQLQARPHCGHSDLSTGDGWQRLPLKGGHRDSSRLQPWTDTVQNWATLLALLIPLASWPSTSPLPQASSGASADTALGRPARDLKTLPILTRFSVLSPSGSSLPLFHPWVCKQQDSSIEDSSVSPSHSPCSDVWGLPCPPGAHGAGRSVLSVQSLALGD